MCYKLVTLKFVLFTRMSDTCNKLLYLLTFLQLIEWYDWWKIALCFAAEQFVISTQFEISFDFRTVQQNGVILTTSNTYSGIAIEMFNGKVHYQPFSTSLCLCTYQLMPVVRKLNPRNETYFVIELGKYVGPVPTYCAAICLELRNSDFWPFGLKTVTFITRALKNVHANCDFSRLFL